MKFNTPCPRFTCLMLLALPLLHAIGQHPSPLNRNQRLDSYGRLPLSFEANEGQTEPRVDFLARGPGYVLFLTSQEALLRLQDSDDRAYQSSNRARMGLRRTRKSAESVLRMQIVGADPNVNTAGIDKLPGYSNYLIDKNPANWRTNIPTYSAVKYEHVYAGIDLLYHGNQRQLEYDFIVAAGAEPERIEVCFQGASNLNINASGDLHLAVGDTDLQFRAPIAYQDIDGHRKWITARYVQRAWARVGFSVTGYDRSKPLVIDPTLSYSTYLGGSGGESIQSGGIAVDSSGHAYVTGDTSSSDFPVTEGAFQTTFAGNIHAFVSKLNATGSALVYSTYLGGTGQDDVGGAIAVDASGQAYVTGFTNSSDFPTTPGAFQTTYRGNGGPSAFVTKLNTTGTALIYSTYLDGMGGSQGTGIAVDCADNAYIVGWTGASDFPTTPGAFQTTLRGATNAFITKLNADGSGLIYSSYLGGSRYESGNFFDIAVDRERNAYVTGNTTSTDFPTTPGAIQSHYGGGGEQGDAFVTKLNGDGSALLYSTYLGGSSEEEGTGIAVDWAGQAYVTGHTWSANFPVTEGAFQTTLHGFDDAFVCKLNATGTALLYSTYLGGNSSRGTLNYARYGIAIDTSGKAYVTGFTAAPDFPTTPDAYQSTYRGNPFNTFLTELNAEGSALLYSTYLGGTGNDISLGVALDPFGGAYMTGTTVSLDFPTTPGAFETSRPGPGGAFISKFSFRYPVRDLEGAPRTQLR